MFVDTHCHLTMLDLSPYDGDLDAAIAQARLAGCVSKLWVSLSILDDHIALSKIAARHADVGYSVGVHPCENAENMARATTEQLIALAQADKVWALGETGLDYFSQYRFCRRAKSLLCAAYSCVTSCKKTCGGTYPCCQARYSRYYPC